MSAAPLLRDRFAAWSYGRDTEATSPRDLRLDLLRGFCVFVMIADHIGGERSWLYLVTGGNRFFVSAAEGFVIISGIVMGSVYRQILARDGILAMVSRCLRRAGFLYVLTVTLTLFFALASHLLQSHWTGNVTPAAPHRFVLSVLTLHRSYSLTDVLLMYTFFVFAAPAMLVLMFKGRTWIVLLGSWTLWLLWQLWPQEVQLPWPIVDGGFPISAWQVLFANGVIVGYHRDTIKRWLTPRRRTVAFAAAGSAAVVLIGLFAVAVASGQASLLTWVLSTDLLFGKNDVRVGRIISIFAVVPFLYGLVTILWRPLIRALGWLLMPLGRNALGAYAVHLFVAAAAASWIGDPLRSSGEHTLIQVTGIAIVWASLSVLPWLAVLEAELSARTAQLRHPLARLLGLRGRSGEAEAS